MAELNTWLLYWSTAVEPEVGVFGPADVVVVEQVSNPVEHGLLRNVHLKWDFKV